MDFGFSIWGLGAAGKFRVEGVGDPGTPKLAIYLQIAMCPCRIHIGFKQR